MRRLLALLRRPADVRARLDHAAVVDEVLRRYLRMVTDTRTLGAAGRPADLPVRYLELLRTAVDARPDQHAHVLGWLDALEDEARERVAVRPVLVAAPVSFPNELLTDSAAWPLPWPEHMRGGA